MSWGPVPLMPRYFLMQKKGFLFELTLFTYVVWLTYLMRMGLKWHLWKTQAILTSIVIFILACLLWRDLITLYTRFLSIIFLFFNVRTSKVGRGGCFLPATLTIELPTFAIFYIAFYFHYLWHLVSKLLKTLHCTLVLFILIIDMQFFFCFSNDTF